MGIFCSVELQLLKNEEKKRSSLLAHEEKLWRLKSRSLWLGTRDKNKKYFHHYASHRKNINTILEIKDEIGGTTQKFHDKAKEAVNHFHKRFTEPPGCPISEILEVLNLFPRLITEEIKQDLLEEVTEEEFNKIIHSFQRGKRPGPDGFTLDFFLGFYDMLKSDILKVVRESQRTGKLLGEMNAIFLTLIPKKQRGGLLRASDLFLAAI